MRGQRIVWPSSESWYSAPARPPDGPYEAGPVGLGQIELDHQRHLVAAVPANQDGRQHVVQALEVDEEAVQLAGIEAGIGLEPVTDRVGLIDRYLQRHRAAHELPQAAHTLGEPRAPLLNAFGLRVDGKHIGSHPSPTQTIALAG